MLILLPIGCWVTIGLICARRGMSMRAAFLAASVIWGVLLTFMTEALSLIAALTKAWIALSWGGALVISLALFFLVSKKESHKLRITFSRNDKVLAGGIALICLATLATALIAPPNNWDSMTYHMSRVVHWLQNRSVAHYPTHITRQLELNPWAEFAIAHFQALSGGDRFANMIQWFSMIGSVVGATLMAVQLGAQQRGQLLAAVLTATIPMGILQASSTQNDYVVAFWLLCFVWSGMRLKEERQLWWALITGSSLGLAILTKGTAYFYALPFVLLFAFRLVRSAKRGTALLFLSIALPVLILNAGHYSRNWTLFANPLGSDTNDFANDRITGGTALSNLVRNSAMHLSTPFEDINRDVEEAVGAFHGIIGMDINDARTTWPGSTYGIPMLIQHEDYSGNLLHAVLAVIIIGLVFCRKSMRNISPAIMPYILSVLSAFFLFCLILRWQPWNSRLHLPLFVLGAPAIGVVLGHLRRQSLALSIAILLLVASLPWLLRNASRPLVPPPRAIMDRLVSGKQLPPTIVTADRIQQYFTNRPVLWKPYSFVTNLIKTDRAKKVGLIMQTGEGWEYPLWVLLDTDGIRARIEHIDVKNPSGVIRLEVFHPELIVNFDNNGYPFVTWPNKTEF